MDSNIIVLFVVIWLVSRVVSSMNKKKKAEAQKEQQSQARQLQGQMPRQLQSPEAQRRLREIYEVDEVPRHLREQLLPMGQQSVADDDIPPYRRQPVKDDIPPYKRFSVEELPSPAQAALTHHIDQIEEERCAAAARAKDEQKQQALQHKRQLMASSGAKQQQSPMPPLTRTRKPMAKVISQKSFTGLQNLPKQEKRGYPDITQGLGLPQDDLIRGIVMAEILGPPRAKAAYGRQWRAYRMES